MDNLRPRADQPVPRALASSLFLRNVTIRVADGLRNVRQASEIAHEHLPCRNVSLDLNGMGGSAGKGGIVSSNAVTW